MRYLLGVGLVGWILGLALAAVPQERGAGAVVIETTSATSTIDAKRLGWNKVHKGKAPFIAPKVPAGEHKLTFCNEYKCIDYRARVRAGRTLALHVDFEPGHVEDVTRTHLAQLARWKEDCKKEDPNACEAACRWTSALSPGRPQATCSTLAALRLRGDPNAGTEAARRSAPELAPMVPPN